MKTKNSLNKYPIIKLGLNFPPLKSIFNIHRWSDFKWEIKAAWQRAFRGYDDSAWWGMNDYLQKLILRLLLELAEHGHGLPNFDNYDYSKEANMTLEECEANFDERHKKWTELLLEIADNFYESLDLEDSQYEVGQNEFRDEYFNSHKIDFVQNDVSSCSSRLITIPNEGYTKEQVKELKNKWLKRDKEIDKYKRLQFVVGMEKLIKIFDYLWD